VIHHLRCQCTVLCIVLLCILSAIVRIIVSANATSDMPLPLSLILPFPCIWRCNCPLLLPLLVTSPCSPASCYFPFLSPPLVPLLPLWVEMSRLVGLHTVVRLVGERILSEQREHKAAAKTRKHALASEKRAKERTRDLHNYQRSSLLRFADDQGHRPKSPA
jgi:hypothetical protein